MATDKLKHQIGDTAGFYNSFTIPEVKEWLPHVSEDGIRAALKRMVRHGTLSERTTGCGRGKAIVFTWTNGG
jgi:hypothetical protein